MDYTSILKAIHKKGGSVNVMDLLGLEATKFDEGFHFAINLQNLNYVKLVDANYNRNQIIVELTTVGTEFIKNE
jgi:hypothetical protein